MFVKSESWGDPVSKEPECSSRLQLSKRCRRCSARDQSSGAWIATLGRAKTWNTPAPSVGNSHFLVFQFCSHASSRTFMLPLSCMCMTTSITHLLVCRPSPSLHSTTQLFAVSVRQPHWPHSLSLSRSCFWSRFASALKLHCVHVAVGQDSLS